MCDLGKDRRYWKQEIIYFQFHLDSTSFQGWLADDILAQSACAPIHVLVRCQQFRKRNYIRSWFRRSWFDHRWTFMKVSSKIWVSYVTITTKKYVYTDSKKQKECTDRLLTNLATGTGTWCLISRTTGVGKKISVTVTSIEIDFW